MTDLDLRLDDDLLAYDEAQHGAHTPGIWPSDVRILTDGKGCRRQLAYRMAGVEPTDEVPRWLTMAALAGTAVHELVERARARAHPTWWLERRVQVPGFDRGGRLDAYEDDTFTVDDVKTKGERSFEVATERGHPDGPDRDQVLLYGLAVEAMGAEVRRCSVSYVNRSTLETHVESWAYDPEEARGVAMRMFSIIDQVTAVDPDEVPRDGRAPHWSPCDTCPFRSRCWDLEPGDDPRDVLGARALPEDVAAAAETLLRLRHEDAENRQAQDYCKLVLRGHNGKVFEDDEGVRRRVSWSREIPAGKGGKLDTRVARELLEAANLPVPLLGSASRLTFPVFKEPKSKT